MKVKLQKAENYYLGEQQKNMHIVDDELYFVIDEKNNQVQLTDKGIALITKSGEDPEFFIMPDIGVKLAEIEKSNASAEEKLEQKESLLYNPFYPSGKQFFHYQTYASGHLQVIQRT